MKIVSSKSSPNYSLRPVGTEPKFIILHYTEKPFDVALEAYLDHKVELSCHYLIHKDGSIHYLVDEKHTAWHAGVSSWHEIDKLNNHSIGIEIDNLGNEPFTETQMESCIELCHYLQKKYNMPSHNIVGHSDIAPDRKWDPGLFLDWQKLLQHNIGIKFTPAEKTTTNRVICTFNDKGEVIEKLQKSLKKIGYKIAITGIFDVETNYVVRAFQSHFCPKVIWKRGGLEYFRDPESIFPWDEVSEEVIKTIIA